MPSVDQQKVAWLESLLDTTIGCYEDHRQELEKVRRELARHGTAGKCVHLGPQRAGELVEEIDVVLDRSALRLHDFEPQRDYLGEKPGDRSRPAQAHAQARPGRASPLAPTNTAGGAAQAAIPVRQGFTNPRASSGGGESRSQSQPQQQQQPQQQGQAQSRPAATAPPAPRGTAPHPVSSLPREDSSSEHGAAPAAAAAGRGLPEQPVKPSVTVAPSQRPQQPQQQQQQQQQQRAVPASGAPASGAAAPASRPPQAPGAGPAQPRPDRAPRDAAPAAPAAGGPKQPSIQAEHDERDDDNEDDDDISDYYQEIQQRYADAEEYEPGEYNPYPSAPPPGNMEKLHDREAPAKSRGGPAARNDSEDPQWESLAGAAGRQPGGAAQPTSARDAHGNTPRGRRNDPYQPLITPPNVLPAADTSLDSQQNNSSNSDPGRREAGGQQQHPSQYPSEARYASHDAPVPQSQPPVKPSPPPAQQPSRPQQRQQQQQQPVGAPSNNAYQREASTATSHNPPPSDSYVTTSNRPYGLSDPSPNPTHPSAAPQQQQQQQQQNNSRDAEPQVIAMNAVDDDDDEEATDEVNYSNNNENADGLNDDRPNDPRPEFEALRDSEGVLRGSESSRPRVRQHELRTAEFRRHSPAFNNSHKVQDRVFRHRLDPVAPTVVEDSPAVEEFMDAENAELERAKQKELERLRKSFRPEQMLTAGSPMKRAIESGALVTVPDGKTGALVLAKAPPPPPDTAMEDQLKRERAVLNIQMERLEREFDNAIARHKESGSEMRYQQLHNRMNRVKRDIERVDRELAEVRRLEK